ncbi:hypothetical protein AB0J86_30570 [Micromonospora sp. NPDC049559]|uniref:hypothetical protein n=1 Tax=Micromonospora sp. NPDC049559 TaxID=3155923 RepID=UPI00344051DF
MRDEMRDLIEAAHGTMREHVSDDGNWCRSCGERHPCQSRRDARSLLIRTGRLVLARNMRLTDPTRADAKDNRHGYGRPEDPRN